MDIKDLRECNKKDIKVGNIIYDMVFSNPIYYCKYKIIDYKNKKIYLEEIDTTDKFPWKMTSTHIEWYYCLDEQLRLL